MVATTKLIATQPPAVGAKYITCEASELGAWFDAYRCDKHLAGVLGVCLFCEPFFAATAGLNQIKNLEFKIEDLSSRLWRNYLNPDFPYKSIAFNMDLIV
jgi:hypothetical protein